MAFATINYFSRSLEKASSFHVVFPDDPTIPRPWGVYYLLHGLSDDHTIWMRRTSIERYVAGLPLVVVMPDGGRGWYTNAVEGYAYEDDLIKDIVSLIERTFPVRAERSGRAIGGLSMGGYGAVKIALKYHEMFAGANSHSGALGFTRLDPEEAKAAQPGIRPDLRQVAPGRSRGPVCAPRTHRPWPHPGIRIDCGTYDSLIDQNRAFHKHLEALHIPHEYQEFPGAHDWAYWDLHVCEAVAFHVKNLELRQN